MLNKTNKLSKFKNKSNYLLIWFLSLIFLFGRSLMGVYIFQIRLGEYLIAFSLILYLYLTVFKRQKIKIIDKDLLYISNIFLFTFIIFAFIKNDNLLNPNSFRSSLYIWTTSFIFVGFYIFNNLTLSKWIILHLNIVLSLSYIFSVITYPQFLIKFFLNFSDKFDFLKASELILIFLFTHYFNKKYFQKVMSFRILFCYSSLFTPLFLYMSRGASLGLIVFVILEVLFQYRTTLLSNFKATFITLFSGLLLFIFSSYLIVDDPLIEESGFDEVINEILQTKNTTPEYIFGFFYDENRFYSQDGNINFRLQIWQDVVSYSLSGKVMKARIGYVKLDSYKGYEAIIGSPYSETLPVMRNLFYRGRDGQNESVHNYLFSVYARGGLIHVLLIIYFYFKLFSFKNKSIDWQLLTLLTPLFIVSFFDASMDSPNFPLLFFLLIGIYFSKIEPSKETYYFLGNK